MLSKDLILRWSLILKSQQNSIDLVTRPETMEKVDFCLRCHAETKDLATHVKSAHRNETRLEKLPFLKRNLRIASKYETI